MSSAAKPALGVLPRVFQALALGVVFSVVFFTAHATPAFEGPFGVLSAVGFLLLAGVLASELLELFGLPHLTAYLLVGIVAGPHVLHLVDHRAVVDLQVVNTLALALIALAGGAELRVELLRPLLRSLSWATLVQAVSGLLGAGAAFLALARFVPFTRQLPLAALLGIALLWGVMAITRSPSATLGILAQLRPDGPLSRFALGFVMSSDVVVTILLSLCLALARPLIEPGAAFSLQELGTLGHEILGSIALGCSVGLLLASYLRLVSGHFLIVLVALGFGLTEGLRYLRFEPLLTFMCAGFVVANLSQQGPKLLHAVEQTGSVVFVVFFATAGAHLDVPLLAQLWPVALALGAVRIVLVVLANRVACRLAGDDPVVQRWGWAPLVSQAGLALGLAALIERSFPSLGAGFRALVVASVALNELLGPVLFKLALDRTGETGRALAEPSS